MVVLPGCMSLCTVCVVAAEARRGCWTPLDWSYRRLCAHMWFWRLNPCSLEEHSVLLTLSCFSSP